MAIETLIVSQLYINMNTSITLEQLMVFILFLLAIGLGIFLILAIKNIVDILKKVNGIVDDNEKSINTILKEAPIILDNVNKITADVQETVEHVTPSITNIVQNVDNISTDVTTTVDNVTHTVDVVGESVEETVEMLKDSTNTIANYLNIIIEVAAVLKGVFSK